MTDPNRHSALEHADYYDRCWQKLGTRLHYTELNRAQFVVDSICRFVGDAGLTILDFGCGRGWMAPFLSPFGSVTGVDFSPFGIESARQHYGAHARFILADADSPMLGLPLNARFDVVVCSEVIEHVEDQEALLRQIAGLLRPAGWCMLTTPNGNVWRRFSEDLRYQHQLQPIERWLSPQQLAALFWSAKFRVRRHEGRPVFGFRVGVSGQLQRRQVAEGFRRLGLQALYGRLIRASALYQLVAAQKVTSGFESVI